MTIVQKKGWSLEEILTTPRLSTPKGRSCKDHLGNVFISQNKMCEYWKVDRVTFKDRIKAGWSLADALTKDNAVKQPCKDHLGNEFSSKAEMCKYWNIDRTLFDSRVSNDWTIEKNFNSITSTK